MTKLAPEWVRTSDPVIRSPARYRWTTAPAQERKRETDNNKGIQIKSKSKSKSSNIGLNIEGIVSFDKSAVATKFNTFFTTIATTLVNNLPAPIGNFGKQDIINLYSNKGVIQDTFAMSTVEVDNIHKMLSSVDSSKATGLDNIPARFL